MNNSKPNELKTFSIDVSVDGDNAMLLDWGNMETVNIPKEDWQQIKEHIDKWFGSGNTHTSYTHVSDIKYATISNIDVNNMKISEGL